MKIYAFAAAAACALSLSAPAFAGTARHLDGCVTTYDSGQMVVCTFYNPYSCNLIKVNGDTQTVWAGSGRSARLARGEYVSVDVMALSGQQVATLVKVHSDRIVRAVGDFQASHAQRISRTLRRITGVRTVAINKELGEVLIEFDSAQSCRRRYRAAGRPAWDRAVYSWGSLNPGFPGMTPRIALPFSPWIIYVG